jgi:hypothetical protein
MTNAEQRIIRLEQLLQFQADAINRLQGDVANLKQQVRVSQAGGYGGGGGGGGIFWIGPVAIAANGNVTNQTVYMLSGGSTLTISTTATVYNVMAVATVSTAGKNIIVAPNGDGTYLAVTQSC